MGGRGEGRVGKKGCWSIRWDKQSAVPHFGQDWIQEEALAQSASCWLESQRQHSRPAVGYRSYRRDSNHKPLRLYTLRIGLERYSLPDHNIRIPQHIQLYTAWPQPGTLSMIPSCLFEWDKVFVPFLSYLFKLIWHSPRNKFPRLCPKKEL